MFKRKPLPPTYFNISLVVILLTHFFIGFYNIIFYPYTLIGILPILAGIYLNLAADKYFKNAGTTVKPFEESTTLIKTGVFKISRNPMYLGMFLILIGISILLGSIIPFLIAFIYAILMGRIFINAEEKMLNEKFENEWIAYKNKVRRWI